MKKMSFFACAALATLFVGCSEEKPQSMLEQARATMPKDANIAVVAYQKANANTEAMNAAWGDASVDSATQAELIKAVFPPAAIKVLDALGIKYDQKVPLAGEVVMAFGMTLKDLAKVETEMEFGACLNTGTVDYPALINLLKTEVPNASEIISEEGEWTIADGGNGKVGMKQLGTGVQIYGSPKATSFAAIETLGADAFIDRAFTPVADADFSTTICVKDINTLAAQSGITANPQAAILADVTTLCATATANVNALCLTIEVATTTADAAKQVEEAVVGLRAMGAMMLPMAAAGAEIPTITDFIKNVSITAADAKVVIAASITPDQLKKMQAEAEAMQEAQMKQMQQRYNFEEPSFDEPSFDVDEEMTIPAQF